MKKVFTFNVTEQSAGQVSVLAENIEQAKDLVRMLDKADGLAANFAVGDGFLEVDYTSGREDSDASDGNHMMQTPQDNAEEHQRVMDEDMDELGAIGEV